MIRIGPRKSALAMWQANYVRFLLQAKYQEEEIEVIGYSTTGDRDKASALSSLDGKGAFTKEIETALLNNEIDLAVHSLKDLPTTQQEGVCLAAVPEREDPRDAFLSVNFESIEELPPAARVSTSSPRRGALVKEMRPDIEIIEIRGNVDTRLKKLQAGEADAMILASAGLRRLGRLELVKQWLPKEIFIPAPAQGALGLQIRTTDTKTQKLLAVLNDKKSEIEITAERAFLKTLEAGCHTPAGANAIVVDDIVQLTAFCVGKDGRIIRAIKSASTTLAEELGASVAQSLRGS